MQLSFKKLGEGVPLIILHGLYGNSDNWYSIGKALSSKYSVYIPDLRNHGKSPHSKNNTYQALVDDIIEFIDYHKIIKPIVLGHSMGGKLAMFLAMLHPAIIKKLIIVDIAPKKYSSLRSLQPHIIQHLNIINAFSSTELKGKTKREEVECEFAIYIEDLRTRNFLLKNLIRTSNGFDWAINVDALRENLPEIMDGPDFDKVDVQKSKNLDFPVLFVRGEKSGYILDEDLYRIKEFFKKAEVVTIFEAGHLVQADQPELFLKSINYFLE